MMKKKLLITLLSMFIILTFTNSIRAQSYEITISCDSEQGSFVNADHETLSNPSVLQVEKDNLYYYREGSKGESQYYKLWIYDGQPWGNLVFFAIATPNEGYDFDGWYIGDTEIGTSYTSANATENITAKFVSNTKKVSGTVLDEDDNPIAGAEVKFDSYDLYKFYTTTTDADGKWSIDAKKNGTYSLSIKKSGYAIFNEYDIVFEETDMDLGSRQLTKLQLTYSTNGNGNTLAYDKTDDVITLTANPASGYQLSEYVITLDPEDDYFNYGVQYNGKSLKFNMPNNSDIDVVGNFAQYIDSIAVNIELPSPGDTTLACPTVTNDILYVDPDTCYIYDMDEAIDNGNWDPPTEFAEGGHYMAEFCIYIIDDYANDYDFKYNKNDDYNLYYNYSRDCYGYDVELAINETTVSILADDSEYDKVYETIGKSGFYGNDYGAGYRFLSVMYQFTVTDNKPAFNNQEFNIKDDYTGTLEFVVDKSYNTDDGSDVTVKVDNAALDASKYDLAKASTHVTLHNDFLKTLSLGEHYLTISIDGYDDATQKFTISSSTPTPRPKHRYEVPNTGVSIH